MEACGPLSPLFNGLACYWVYLGRIGLDGQLNPTSSFTILGLVSNLGMVFKAILDLIQVGFGLLISLQRRLDWVDFSLNS